MSCLANVDPYNNYPDSKRGGPPPSAGGNTHTFTKQAQLGASMAQRPRPAQQLPPLDVQSERDLLIADLQLAIGYIKHLGGSWPPPGH